jgi:bifunctional N-acetylglucosamine-1-phosphate-uridyltransferase/glucosamine-1-phosphate-acetyltransferase GlmU-like protein
LAWILNKKPIITEQGVLYQNQKKAINLPAKMLSAMLADRKKYKTKIGNRVFVGSDTQFVAPIEVGDDAIIGSGSTITKNVPAKALAVARGKQFIKENYAVKSEEAVTETESK